MSEDGRSRDVPRVPPMLDVAAALSWRLLLVAAAVVVLAFILVRLRLVLLPAIFALFVSAVLSPAVARLHRRGVPPGAATAFVILVGLGALSGLGFVFAPSVGREFADLGPVLRDGVRDVGSWLTEGPLGVSEAQVREATESASNWIRGNTSSLVAGVVTGATVAVELVAGFLVSIFLTFFFVKDGDRIVGWFLGHVDPEHQDIVRALGRRTWAVLGAYLRGTTIVALVDSTVIGVGLVLIGVPLVAPLMLLVFMGAYFPLVGATLAGVVAALVALVSGGVVDALLVVGVVIGVQQVEGHVLAPIVLGRAVRLHPAVIIVALTGGAVIGGIVGAFLAVPLTAALAAAGNEFRIRRRVALPDER